MKHHNIREMRIEIHRGKDGAVAGHTVHHHMLPAPGSKSGAFMEDTHESYPFGARGEAVGKGPNMARHIMQHLAGGGGAVEEEAEGE